MVREVCKHPVFPCLRAKLIAANIGGCPTCLLRLHVLEITETQAAVERRGGIFTSKATAIDELEKDNRKDLVAHKTLMRRWRLATIDLYEYTEDDDRLVDEEKSELKIGVNLEHYLNKEGLAHSQLEGDNLKADAVRLQSIARISFNLLHDIDVKEERNNPQRMEGHATSLSVCRRDGNSTTTPSRRTSAPSISLKLHVDNYVTVICDADACGTSRLPLGQTSYKRPQFSYTTAETARMRHEFDRVSKLYTPSTWALPDEYENVNTGHYKPSWGIDVAVQQTEDFKESEDLKASDHLKESEDLKES
ncbi:hypothetical protein SVAN01_09082 [Stagonosporopsis vannaccii]|nr:hypothetical protein SVAN01_09082 [Stagonosporopsis vannaccii]